MSSDLDKIKGTLRLKNGTVPTIFMTTENQILLESDDGDCAQSIDPKSSCNECSILMFERDDLNKMVVETKINSDVKMEHSRVQIDVLSDKCREQAKEIRTLKEKMCRLEAQRREFDSRVENLKEQLLNMHVSGLEVNILYHLLMYSISI